MMKYHVFVLTLASLIWASTLALDFTDMNQSNTPEMLMEQASKFLRMSSICVLVVMTKSYIIIIMLIHYM